MDAKYLARFEQERLWAHQVRFYETFLQGVVKPVFTPMPNRADRRKVARKKGW